MAAFWAALVASACACAVAAMKAIIASIDPADDDLISGSNFVEQSPTAGTV